MTPKEFASVRASAFAKIGDYAEWGEEGLRLKDTSHLSPEQRAACVVTRGRGKDGTETIEVTVPGKLEALEKLRAMLTRRGSFSHHHRVTTGANKRP